MSKKYVIPSKRHELPPAGAIISAEITENAFPTLIAPVNKKVVVNVPNYKMCVTQGEEKKYQEELIRLQQDGWVILKLPPPGTRKVFITTGYGGYTEDENTIRPKPYERYLFDDIVVSAMSYYDPDCEEEPDTEEEPDAEEPEF